VCVCVSWTTLIVASMDKMCTQLAGLILV
jgi:hypothetical protein